MQVIKANEVGSKIIQVSLVADHNTEKEKRTVGKNAELGVEKLQTAWNVTNKFPDWKMRQIKQPPNMSSTLLHLPKEHRY